MPLLTTTIGAYPKPDYVPVPDWFQQEYAGQKTPTKALDACTRCVGEEAEALLDRATREVVEEQVDLGIDIPTDGEIRREDYIYYHGRHLDGIDFFELSKKSMRSGIWEAAVPTIVGPIRPRDHFLHQDWKFAQSFTDRPVKITVPGPMTLCDSLKDEYYHDDRKLVRALAEALNFEICYLAEAGCRWIQVDEPVFARKADDALAYGIDNVQRCFHGVDRNVIRAVHICCGYPDKLDSEHYQKADPEQYIRLAPALDDAEIHAVSLEDAHRYNTPELLEYFKKSTVMLGVIDIARSRVEPVEEITARLHDVLGYIDAKRLMVAPDCGLGFLNRELVKLKIANMVKAAKAV